MYHIREITERVESNAPYSELPTMTQCAIVEI